jgi:hypothetical protein
MVAAMEQGRRLFLFFVMFLGPMVPTFYVVGFDVKNANLAELAELAELVAVAATSLAAAIWAALQFKKFIEPSVTARVSRAGLANLIFVVVDVTAFALLVYGRRFAAAPCDLGALCSLYPVTWLTLAGMHFCYAVVGVVVRPKDKS